MSARVKLLATVHIARKEMGWDDATYRAILARTVGKHSAGDCTDKQLGVLLDEFRKLGWKSKGAKRPSDKSQVRLIYSIWKEIKPLLDGKAGDAELRAFVRRQTKSQLRPDGVAAPEFLDAHDAVRVIEGLKGWRDKLRARPRPGPLPEGVSA